MASHAPSTTRRRGDSRASSLSSNLTLLQKPGAPSPAALGTVEPRSAHVSDPFLHDFLQADFDPAAFWNRTLANAPGTSSAGSLGGRASPGAGAGTGTSTGTSTGAARRLAATATSATATADRASHAQTTLSQLGAHTSRLTAVLTQLTDDILRSGSRLAYEVELLRGETIGLAELVQQQAAAVLPETSTSTGAEADGKTDGKTEEPRPGNAPAKDPSEPEALAQLRMLAQVRDSLDAVIRTFGDAMEFTMPPSAMSVTASFLSVSGPDQDSRRRSPVGAAGAAGTAGSAGAGDAHAPDASATSMEDKGQQVLKAKRDEIETLLAAATAADDDASMAAAEARVAALRTLCRVWQGTAEEKPRAKFVDSLQRLVDERRRELEREREKQQQQERQQREAKAREAAAAAATGSGLAVPSSGSMGQGTQGAQDASGAAKGYAAAGYGFISQLQKIRSGL